MSAFERIELSVNGVDTVILAAGEGPPLMFWHGAGTFTGFEFAFPWTNRFKLLIPYHPGFGESGDNPDIAGIKDYVAHYQELMERLGLKQVNLVGFSMGGWMAASFAARYPDRVRKLALVAPAGLGSPSYDFSMLFRLSPNMLTTMPPDLSAMMPHLTMLRGADFVFRQYREMASATRLAQDGMTDRQLTLSLHRLTMPVLLLWGEQDPVVPVQQLAAWRKLLPDAAVARFPAAGHLVLDEAPAAVTRIMDFMG